MFKITTLALAFAASIAAIQPSSAQTNWPTKNVRIVVPFAAGGATDVVARKIGEILGKSGTTVIIENKPGASGAIGALEVARSAPDGHTLVLTINSFATLTPHLTKMNIAPLTDLVPVIETTRNTLVLIGNKDLPANNFKDLISYVKSKPGQINYASYAFGSVSHLAGLLLNDGVGTDMVHVGYKGSPPATTDLLGGHIPLYFDSMVGSAPLLKDAKVKGYAVNSPTRHPLAPDVPTFRELGHPEMELLAAWIVIMAPKGTPTEIVNKVSDVIGTALDSDQFAESLKTLAFLPRKTRSPTELRKELEVESQKLGEFVRAKNITLNAN